MLLDLSRLRSGVETLTRRYEPPAFGLEHEDFRLVAPVDLVGEVRKDAQKARLTGRLTTTLECDCGRCLEPFAVPVDAKIDVILLPSSENSGDAEQEVAEDDLGVSYYKDDVVDLGELMREQFYLAVPMKPLCQEDCRGLCPVCGINRNRETCTCETTWVDPRMEALRRFRLNEETKLPNPKRRHSKTRTAKRRTHDALKPRAMGECPQCHEMRPPHQVCPNCGYYKGRQVREVAED